MNILVTGGAGFIASNLEKKLLENGNKVIAIDNLVLGKLENIESFNLNQNFKFYNQDVNNIEKLCNIMRAEGIEAVFHLAANSDIQKSSKQPTIDSELTFNTTLSVLESMRIVGVKKLFFSSTSAVYGEKLNVDLDEETPNLHPVSYYGAGKLASEAFISAYTHMNDLSVLIFRFPNVIGPNLTHGVIYDFYKKLLNNQNELIILGDGTQRKPYIYVEDLVDVILERFSELKKGIELYTVGVDSNTSVTEIADIVCKEMNLCDVNYKYTGGKIGWKGDVPSFKYKLNKIWNTGWKAKFTSNEAVKKTIEWLIKNNK